MKRIEKAFDLFADDIINDVPPTVHIPASKHFYRRMDELAHFSTYCKIKCNVRNALLMAKFKKKSIKLIRFSIFYKTKHRVRYALLAALITLIICSTTILAIEPLRDSVYKFIKEIFTRHADVATITQSSIVIHNKIKHSYEIEYPSQFILVDKIENDTCTIAVLNSSEKYINLEQYRAEGYQSSIDTENAKTIDVKINGITALYVNATTQNILIWNLDDYVFSMTSNLKQSEMILISESIYIIKE